VIRYLPPLVIDRADIDRVVAKTAEVLEKIDGKNAK
jgi:acetylornithine/succinyldiaminopimelate/putrescine aminotransferase